jgi:chromatin remodeling complex protein RSC6
MPSKSKNPQAKKGSKKTKTPVEKTVPVVVEETAPVVVEETPPVEETAPVVVETIDSFMVYPQLVDIKAHIKALVSLTRDLSGKIVTLEKQIARDKRVMDKVMKKKKPKVNADGSKPLNGFSKPGMISEELRAFMGLDASELVARVDVTKFITKYCQTNGLHNEKDKRILLPDAKLQSLLKVDKGVELTYFNLQKYLKFHFPNKDGEYLTQ